MKKISVIFSILIPFIFSLQSCETEISGKWVMDADMSMKMFFEYNPNATMYTAEQKQKLLDSIYVHKSRFFNLLILEKEGKCTLKTFSDCNEIQNDPGTWTKNGNTITIISKTLNYNPDEYVTNNFLYMNSKIYVAGDGSYKSNVADSVIKRNIYFTKTSQSQLNIRCNIFSYAIERTHIFKYLLIVIGIIIGLIVVFSFIKRLK